MEWTSMRKFAAAGIAGTLLFGTASGEWKTTIAYAAPAISSVTSAKEIQDQLAAGLEARKTQIKLLYKGSTAKLESLMSTAMSQALDQDPYTKYVVNRYSYEWEGTSEFATVSVKFQYRETLEQSNYVFAKIKSIVAEIIQPDMNDHQKIKAIHDYVVRYLKYDQDLQKFTAYEGLTTREAVCQGYALMTYRMLRDAGIDNLIIEGKVNNTAHAWNLVLLDGKWYHLDTTWDDPVPDEGDRVRYTYFLLTDDQIRKDHSWTLSYPAAATAYRDVLGSLIAAGGGNTGYYKELYKTLEYDLFDDGAVVTSREGIRSKVVEALNDNRSSVTIRYGGSEQSLLRHLRELYTLNLQNIKYNEEQLEGTNDLKVEIVWEK
ncbi:MAG: transglutaminase domain-containing protein [Paenibacillus macerans]|uniref:transglutaminase domain-containing protein n=1 Tax=Paenibacillus macerans TaxID=44252 RepID=UPI00290CE3E1|nr:transglutaminase domain-containing protein [Paenibacillus macerans]MDU7475217.1 transglutaminase domain-containing protein [Paenibacillus macerans]